MIEIKKLKMCRYQAGMVEHALNSIITTLQFQINKLFYL